VSIVKFYLINFNLMNWIWFQEAKALSARGVEVLNGSLFDESFLTRALHNVDVLYINTFSDHDGSEVGLCQLPVNHIHTVLKFNVIQIFATYALYLYCSPFTLYLWFVAAKLYI
jgi:hypothetical protein